MKQHAVQYRWYKSNTYSSLEQICKHIFILTQFSLDWYFIVASWCLLWWVDAGSVFSSFLRIFIEWTNDQSGAGECSYWPIRSDPSLKMTLFKVHLSEYSWETFSWWSQLPIFTFVMKDFTTQMIENRNTYFVDSQCLAESYIVNMCLDCSNLVTGKLY